MNVFKLIRVSMLSLVALTVLASCGGGSGGREASDKQPSPDQDEEAQMGQEVFNELKAKGEIIESSPLYEQLKPIADAITKAVQPRYNHPFKFFPLGMNGAVGSLRKQRSSLV
jgi:hypothetical protein